MAVIATKKRRGTYRMRRVVKASNDERAAYVNFTLDCGHSFQALYACAWPDEWLASVVGEKRRCVQCAKES